jgi:ribose/xylose/arabinose/galactoside ABC-type transport system permease subunit
MSVSTGLKHRADAIRRVLAGHSPLIILAVLCLILAAVSPDFRGRGNLQQVGLRTCVIAIMAIGQILVILTAGIDLSVGSVAALSAVVAAILMTESTNVAFFQNMDVQNAGWPVPVAVAAGCATGLLCGAINGLLVTLGRIPPFIVTLGMMMAARGASMLLAGSVTIGGLPKSFRYLGGSQKIGEMGTAWIPISIALAIAFGFAVVLSHTRFGRALYATGGNLTGARLSGIRVDAVRVGAYSLCGMLAGFSGIMLAARTSIADPAGAGGYELDAIAACVIGGTSLMGGEGGALGVLAGALIMNVLVNFCNLNDISVHWQRVLVGSLIVALVYYDNVRKRRAGLLKDG